MNEKRQKGLPMYPGSKKLYTFLTILIMLESVAIIAQAYFLAGAITALFESTPMFDVISDIGFFFVAFILGCILSHIQTALAEIYALHKDAMLRESVVRMYLSKI